MAHTRAASKPQQTSPTPMNRPSVGSPPSSDANPSFWKALRNNPLLLYTTILNPVLVLHFINGLLSLLYPETIQHPILETSIQPHLDVHANDRFCRLFTVIMVALQSALYSSHAPKMAIPIPWSEDSDEDDLNR